MTNKTSKNEALVAKLRNYGARTSYRSPLVAMIGQSEAIGDYPACATCPGGMWLVTDDLRCFCKILKQYTYGIGNTSVIACDERELLLAEK